MKKYIIIIVGFLFLISNFCYAGYKKHQYLDSGQTQTFCLNDQNHYIIASTELDPNTLTRSKIVLTETDTFFNIINSYEFIENTFNYNYEIRDIIECSPGRYILCGVYEYDSAFIAFVDGGFNAIHFNYSSDLQSCNDVAKFSFGAVACGRDNASNGFVLYFDYTFNQLNILDYWRTNTACPCPGWEFHKISNETTQAAFSVIGTSLGRNYGYIAKFGFDPSNLTYLASGIFPNNSNNNSYYGIYAFDDICFTTNSYQSDIIIHKLEQNGFNFTMTDQTQFTGIGDTVFLKDFRASDFFSGNMMTFAWTGYYYNSGMGNYSGFIATVDNVHPSLLPSYSNPQLYSYSSTDINCNIYLNHLGKVFGFSSIGNYSCSYSNSNEIICAHPINSNICNEAINTFNIQPNITSLPIQGSCLRDKTPNITFLILPFNSTRIFTTDSCFGPGNMNKNNISLNKDNNFSVEQNQSNPSNQNSVISYSIPKNGEVYFKISDISGKIIYQQNINANAGDNNLEIKTNEFSSGIYFYCMEYNGYKIVKKMVVQR